MNINAHNFSYVTGGRVPIWQYQVNFKNTHTPVEDSKMAEHGTPGICFPT